VQYLTGDSPIIANHSNMKRMLPICTKVFSKKWISLSRDKNSVSVFVGKFGFDQHLSFKKLQLPDLLWPVAWCWHHLVHVVFVQAILYIDNNLNNYFTESVALGSRKRVW